MSTATAAFFEHLPIRRDAVEPDRVWHSLRYGRTAEVFVLDSRSERKPSTLTSSGQQYLSPQQLEWLKGALMASPCVFKVLLNSVPITNFPGLLDFVANDRWEGYPAARNDILCSRRQRAASPACCGWRATSTCASTGRVSPSGAGSRAIEVLAGPGAQVANPLGVGRAMPFASSCIRPCRVDLGLPHPNCVGGNRQVRIPCKWPPIQV